MCYGLIYRVKRTILTPIRCQHEYNELHRLLQRLMYRRLLVPPPPKWEAFLPCRPGLGGWNVLCFPVFGLLSLCYVFGLLLSPLVSLLLLLCCPLVSLSQLQCCLCSAYREGEKEQSTVYYQLRLHAVAGYPFSHSSLDGVTEHMTAYLLTHGVTRDQIVVVDVANFEPSGCVTIPTSPLTAEGMAALQAKEKEQQHTQRVALHLAHHHDHQHQQQRQQEQQVETETGSVSAGEVSQQACERVDVPPTTQPHNELISIHIAGSTPEI